MREVDNGHTPSVGAVIVAAGRSTRLGRDKLFADLAGLPVLSWSLAAFESSLSIASIALVVNDTNRDAATRLVQAGAFGKVRSICQGGSRRQDSVLEGLKALGPHEWVAVHDGARPLVTPDLIERGIRAAGRSGAAIPGVPLKDTIKVIREDGRVLETLDRSRLRAIQTPQVFRYDLLLDAYGRSVAEVTDDSALLEALGCEVVVYPGENENLKITTADDLLVAEALIQARLSLGPGTEV